MILKQVMLKQIVVKEHEMRAKIDNPQKVVNFIVKEICDLDREALVILNLDTAGAAINYQVVSIGALDRSIAEPREIIKNTILSNARSFIMIHNHPSYSLKPSDSDVDITARMAAVANLMNITLSDHVITNPSGEVYSFRESGLLRQIERKLPTSFGLSDVKENSNDYQTKEYVKRAFNDLSLRDQFEIVLQGEREEYINADQETIDRLYEAFENNDEMLGLMNSNDIDTLEAQVRDVEVMQEMEMDI